MEEQESPELVASWKAERRWFQRTVGFSASLIVGLLAVAGIQYWAYLRMKEIFAAVSAIGTVSTPESADIEALSSALSPIMVLGCVAQVFLFVSGLGFLISLVKWLFAIRHRRAIHAGAFPNLDR